MGGCAAEGKLAAREALKYIQGVSLPAFGQQQAFAEKTRVFAPLLQGDNFDGVSPLEMEERMQRLMDEYAGGISQFYRTDEERLDYALKHLDMLKGQTGLPQGAPPRAIPPPRYRGPGPTGATGRDRSPCPLAWPRNRWPP